mgnify:CR=1 FL=1
MDRAPGASTPGVAPREPDPFVPYDGAPMAEDPAAPPALVIRKRQGATESVHRGWAALWENAEVRSVGDPWTPVFTRSCTKPFQALAFVASGAADRFGCTAEEIAVACSSHNGETEHRSTVARMLGRAGLSEGHLRCGKSEPFGERARREFHRRGEMPSAIVHNCSGKHAGFLLTQVHLGGPRELPRPRLAGAASDPRHDRERDGCVRRGARPRGRRLLGPHLPPAIVGVGRRVRAPRQSRARPRRDRTPPFEDRRGRHIPSPPLFGDGAPLPRDPEGLGRGGDPQEWRRGVYAFGVRGKKLGFAVKVEDGNHHGYEAMVVRLLRRLGSLGEGRHPNSRDSRTWTSRMPRDW